MAHALTEERIIAPGAGGALSAVIERHGFGKRLMLVCDDATWVAAGQKIHEQLTRGQGYEVKAYSLGVHVKPLLSHATELAANAQNYDALISVGAGTINDITKQAAFSVRKPYITVPTAASMNGYTSAGASLLEHGFKHAYMAAPPRAVVVDLDVIAAAPKRLTRAGLGDTLCRSTVEVDAILSHHVMGTSYPKEWFDKLRDYEGKLIAHASKLRDGDGAFLSLLVSALLDAGDAMAATGSSAIASQGEHMIAHTAELMYGVDLGRVMHGEMVAVTSISMGHLQQKMLLSAPVLRSLPQEYEKFLRSFGKMVGGKLAASYAAKVLSPERAAEINEKLVAEWAGIKEAIQRIMLSANTIERAYLQSGVPTKPSGINLSDERYLNACNYAYLTRDRFTFLDLAAMMNKRF